MHARDHSNRPALQQPENRIYSLCSFAQGVIVPDVRLIEAATDAEAIEIARDGRLFTTRELWDRHRLVAVIPPPPSASA